MGEVGVAYSHSGGASLRRPTRSAFGGHSWLTPHPSSAVGAELVSTPPQNHMLTNSKRATAFHTSTWARWESNPHDPQRSRDFKSRASASSATRPMYSHMCLVTRLRTRRGPDLNRRITILQTAALPLGYRAIKNKDTHLFTA